VIRSLLLVVLGLGGCSAQAGDVPGQEWRYAETHADCAPWDGAATTITLSDAPIGSTPTDFYLVLSVYRSPSDVDGTTRIDGRQAEGMSARLCPAVGDCVPAQEGSVTLTTTDSGIGGRYALRLSDGRRLTGSFRARMVAFRVLCG